MYNKVIERSEATTAGHNFRRVALATSLWLAAGSLAAAELAVSVTGFESDSGNLMVSVYNSKSSWLGDSGVEHLRIAVADALQDGRIDVQFDLEPGVYAVSLYQDENENGKLDTGKPIPIPKEPIGLSNNKRPRFGPPRYKRSVFSLADEPLAMEIRLQHKLP